MITSKPSAMMVGAVLAGMSCFTASAFAVVNADVTAPGDPITGIFNTVAGGNSNTSTAGFGVGQFPPAEAPNFAIDNLFASGVATKYLNFGMGSQGTSSATQGTQTGFFVTPASGLSIVNAVRFAAANDSPTRDPLAITIEGSNAASGLDQGSAWTLIYNGTSGLDTDPGRFTQGPIVNFVNVLPFTSYRLLVTAQRGVDNSVQYGEVELIGTSVPEPSVIMVLGLGGLLLGRRRD
jgi:hypothetical protein